MAGDHRTPGAGDADAAPRGFTLRHTLTGHGGWIGRIAWSPDGRRLASPSADRTIRVWDAETGALLQTLQGHGDAVLSVAWSPAGDRIVSGSRDGSVQVWDLTSGAVAKQLLSQVAPVRTVEWADGDLVAAGDRNGVLRAWHVTNDAPTFQRDHLVSVRSVAFSPDGRMLAAGSGDHTVRVWSTADWREILTFRGHTAYVFDIAWSPDGQTIASASGDRTIGVWSTATEGPDVFLEGHTGRVCSVSFSADGELLASKSSDGTVRLWKTAGWRRIAVLPERSISRVFPGAAFHPRDLALATLGARDTHVRIWDLDVAATTSTGGEVASRSLLHKSAKVVLVGDSGVGKTSLAWRLVHGEFAQHLSTHGQQFWIADALGGEIDGVDCQVALWDLAGQPDYRLVHALFLDDADLALVLFDPTRRDPWSGAEYWLRALASRDSAACPSILVSARIDRGDIPLSDADVSAFCLEHGIAEHVATSANTGAGIEALVAAIRTRLDWEHKTATVTNATFRRIKDHVLRAKEDPSRYGILTDGESLVRRLQELDPSWHIEPAAVWTAMRRLAHHGYARVLRTASGKRSILLAPDVLNNLAASFLIEARRNPQGLGTLDEDRALCGDYPLPELDDLEHDEAALLLDATVGLFVQHDVCFRTRIGDRKLLVFPELINQRPPRTSRRAMQDDAAYRLRGSVDNAYAAIVVQLGYTNIFRRTAQWKDQAEFEMDEGEVCGFRQTWQGPGELELVLFFSSAVAAGTRRLFQELFERFVSRRGIDVRRYEPRRCPGCGYEQDRAEVVRRLDHGRSTMFCSECGREIDLSAPSREQLGHEGQSVLERQGDAVEARRRAEAALPLLWRCIAAHRPLRGVPDCYVSYAWGVVEHESWVESWLCPHLEYLGIEIVHGRDNSVGAGLARFVERIPSCRAAVVVGTPLLLEKYGARSGVVASEIDLINNRLLSGAPAADTVLPVLLAGEAEQSLPPLLSARVFADFRGSASYLSGLFDLALSVHGVPTAAPEVAQIRNRLRGGDSLAMEA